MNILVVDTSSEYCSASIFMKGKRHCCFSITQYAPRRHNENLLPIINRLIQDSGICKKEINLFAYGVGPGSFVGIRLAASVIYAMSLSVPGSQVVGFSSMQTAAIAGYHLYKEESIGIILDACKSEVYFKHYIWDKDLGIMKTYKEGKWLKHSDFENEYKRKAVGFLIGNVVDELAVKINLAEYKPDVSFSENLIRYNYKKLQYKSNGKNSTFTEPMYLKDSTYWRK